ncbi:MAG: M14 family zinc carboxypeptidase [Weeksellaceae bacterium]
MKNIKPSHSLFKESSLNNRYIPPSLINQLIKTKEYAFHTLGTSFEGRPIHLLNCGKGIKQILLWSQMHGNESTATRAMLDVWNFLHSDHPLASYITSQVSIDYIPQLNPDGAYLYTRRNAIGIDLNRDFIAEQSTELPILKNQVQEKDYQFLFNMHDQRSIFHPKNQQSPATLSFLSPSVDELREINDTRKRAMQLIISMVHGIIDDLPNGIAKFTDEFYPKATGDNFQKLGFPTILIECGHYARDYNREKTREYTFNAIICALKGIADDSWKTNEIDDYFNLLENDNKALDIIFRNVKVKNDKHESIVDLGALYKEVLVGNKIMWLAHICEIGDLNDRFGYEEFDAEGKIFSSESHPYPQLEMKANFNLGDLRIKNGKVITA